MTCEDVAVATPDYLTGDLEPQAAARVRAHLIECGRCRTELEGLSEVWARLGVLPDELPGPNLREGFYAMLEAHPRDPEEVRRPVRRILASGAWRSVAPSSASRPQGSASRVSPS
jgi:predicted anti-sigma-YlaC factor YlaD